MTTIKKIVVKTRSNHRKSSSTGQYPKTLVTLLLIFLFLSTHAQSDTTLQTPEKLPLNDTLILQLHNIEVADQQYRNQMDPVRKKYGPESKEFKSLLKKMRQADSINLLKATTLKTK
jgi:hypothetical protein